MSGRVRVHDARPKFAAVPWTLLAEPGHKPNHIALYAALAKLGDWHGARECEATFSELKGLAGFTRWQQIVAARDWLKARGYLDYEEVSKREAHVYTLLPVPANRTQSVPADRTRSVPADRTRSVPADRTHVHIPEGGSPLPPGARASNSDRSAADGQPGGWEGFDPEATPWPAIAAALPPRLAERIAVRHGQQVLMALADLRGRGWTDSELVMELLGSGWPALSSANVPGLALLARCKAARATVPPHVEAERAAAVRAEQEAGAAEQAAAAEHARQLREALEAEADELLAKMSDGDLAQLRRDAEAAAIEQQLTGPDGRPIRAVVHGLMQAFAWGDSNPTPGPLLPARAAHRATEHRTAQV